MRFLLVGTDVYILLMKINHADAAMDGQNVDAERVFKMYTNALHMITKEIVGLWDLARTIVDQHN